MERLKGRAHNKLREITFETNVNKYAEGSCLISFGDTKVLCTASVDGKVPPFLKNTGKGWISAEYGMLPRSTHERIEREASKGKQTGRTQEIQRLIGRSLRAVVNLESLGEKQIKIDCDVIQADGGTRTASICGSYVAMFLAMQKLVNAGTIKEIPIKEDVAAISCGIKDGKILLDLDYLEDSSADVDANFVMTSSGKIIEAQSTAEQTPMSKEEFDGLFNVAKEGIMQIIAMQRKAIFSSK